MHIKMKLFIAVAALPMASIAQANDAVDFANSEFEKAGKIGTTPQTSGEYLTCAAHWQKWKLWLDSVSDKQSLKMLRAELSAKNAEEKSNFWYDKASEEILIVDEMSPQYMERLAQKADKNASENYTTWVNQDANRRKALPSWLGSCR